MARTIQNYYEYFDNFTQVELEIELSQIEDNSIDITGNNYYIDASYITALYDYLEDKGYFI